MEQLTQVTPHIWQLVLPMAPPLDSVNVHIIADGDGAWAVVDTGPFSLEAQDLFEQAFATLGGTVSQIIVTHFHPDHLGMAGWLCQKYNAPLTMTQTEWLTARWLSRDDSPAYLQLLADYYTNHGVPQPVLGEILARGNPYTKSLSGVPAVYNRVRMGSNIIIGGQHWEVITGEGHAPEQMLLYNPAQNVLISADHVVAKITPNISVWAYNPFDNSLKGYLESLNYLVQALPAELLVLPGHGRIFNDFRARCQNIIAHHVTRLEKLHQGALAANGTLRLYDLCKIMFPRELSATSTVFAMGEAHAHVNYLVAQGKLQAVDGGFVAG